MDDRRRAIPSIQRSDTTRPPELGEYLARYDGHRVTVQISFPQLGQNVPRASRWPCPVGASHYGQNAAAMVGAVRRR
jgi:hypothetical protein